MHQPKPPKRGSRSRARSWHRPPSTPNPTAQPSLAMQQIAESAEATASPKEIPTGLTMEELEKLAITKALDQCGGNRTHAANRLGISVRTLQRKLRQYELEKRVKPFPNDVLTEA